MNIIERKVKIMIRNELLEKEYNGNVLEDVCDIIDTAQKSGT